MEEIKKGSQRKNSEIAPKFCGFSNGRRAAAEYLGGERWPEMTGLRNERKFAIGRSER
jgi:hypothetical protein